MAMPAPPVVSTPEMPVQELADGLVRALLQGETMASLRGLTEQDLDAVYFVGRQLYAQARYQDARRLFQFLMRLNHLEGRYFMAHAACLQMLKRYEKAILHYSMASVFDMTDPRPTFHSCECLIALGRVPEALDGLGMVIAQSGQPEHAALRQRAEALRALIARQSKVTEGSIA